MSMPGPSRLTEQPESDIPSSGLPLQSELFIIPKSDPVEKPEGKENLWP